MLLLVWGCSSTKHVPEGKYLLDHVTIDIEGDKKVSAEGLRNFLRQQPNYKVLGFARIQLSTYSLSGNDSTKWYNRWLRKLGKPPVIYNQELTDASRRQLQQALVNRGYMDASVVVDTVFYPERKRADVRYCVTTGKPHIISSFNCSIADSALRSIIESDSALIDIHPGDKLDRDKLDNVRSTITRRLRNEGYFAFNREYISFTADTARGSKNVGLTLNLRNTMLRDTVEHRHRKYVIRSVTFITEDESEEGIAPDTVDYRNIRVIYGGDRYIRPSALYDMCFIEPGQIYSATNVDRTYASLSRLTILRFINISMNPVVSDGDKEYIDAVINISRNKKRNISVELEGTNSEGDLGFGVGTTFQNRNLTGRSELFTVKLRTAYESVSGNLDGLINNSYREYAAEVGLTSPKFILPFASREFKKRMQASTEFAISFNYQERPEYTRIIGGLAWRWKWNTRRNNLSKRHTIDVVDLNYVRLPKTTSNFIDEIAPDNPLLRYAYEDHLIMRMGYTYTQSNRRIPTAEVNAFAMQPRISTVRFSVEMAGNLLYGFSKLFARQSSDGVYKVGDIQFAQYVKGELDYTFVRNFNARNALAFHVGVGAAYPYGNSKMVPFEKRFYAGGANNVRGWGVRTLGPGSYNGHNLVSDFMNQSGDISLALSMEYRAKLFWVLESALFIDAGNIWTIKDYPNQPGGCFELDTFYKQIALAYGIGLRFDFTYFLLRLDMGMKAHNPAANQERWPLLHPSWKRDANFHFSVGYPF